VAEWSIIAYGEAALQFYIDHPKNQWINAAAPAG
jgi:hypothetical protein